MLRHILILIFAILVSGCVGIGNYTQTQFKMARSSDPVMSKTQSVLGRTKEQVRIAWGEPKAKFYDNENEVWTYHGKGDLAWRGIVVWIVLPIPLMMPVGSNDVRVEFNKEGVVIRLYAGEVDADFYGCNIKFVCGKFDDVTHPTL
jgi:hypothetical protein